MSEPSHSDVSSYSEYSSFTNSQQKQKLRCWSKGSENLQQTFCMAFSVDFTVYNFAIADEGGTKWFVQKRFSQFDQLDDELNKKFPDVMINVQRLPPKKFMGSLSPSLIAMRQKALDAYLSAVLSRPILASSDELRDFIEMPLDLRGRESEEQRHNLAAQDALRP
uniref:PX domain-containing protein n=2 Tax=Hemiselmis andersenii TaxID=464988 RepID=A0A6U2C382_HEMAN|mmetsp:Transcript_18796/g.43374  ORF Transcript_18796/g.43374 Transcript_18796/m.43374 type:complete len:165 (+) Transcript_18796:31-525(+)